MIFDFPTTKIQNQSRQMGTKENPARKMRENSYPSHDTQEL
jgi:hypothetical protein